MNPAAKEFVPAHILKKRQEEAKHVENIAEQLDKVNIQSDEANKSKTDVPTTSGETRMNQAGDDKVQDHEKSSNIKLDNNQSSKQTGELDTNDSKDNKNLNSSNDSESEYPEGLHDLVEEEDDRFLLRAGEEVCEFNGEQFIIPGDDECEDQVLSGYDFGNAEDNEDEDVCNAFEEFLGKLPPQ